MVNDLKILQIKQTDIVKITVCVSLKNVYGNVELIWNINNI